MNIAEHVVVSTAFEGSCENTGVLQIIQSNGSITLPSEVQEIEVLCYDRRRWSRKIQGEAVFDAAKRKSIQQEM